MANKFEHLLSVDPIGAFEKIKDNYKRYFQSAYQLRTELSSQKNYSALNKERIDLLEKDDNLYKSPYIEMLPKYITADENEQQKLDKEFENVWKDGQKDLFKTFIKSGLMSYTPYVHQIEMLKHAFIQGQNTIITSGTGSGKTEAFLLPLLAQIFNEALTWPSTTYSPTWFQTNPYEPCQREGENRDAALRAIVLYPMNALVEDQVRRLRGALDSNDVRHLMDQVLKGNRIFFGQYNGNTIGQKSYDLLKTQGNAALTRAQNKVSERLGEIADGYQSILNQANSKDNEFITTRLDSNHVTSEMVTRWDMQQFPPDIMITNISMLSIMLMRTAEESIIEKTRNWLKGDPYLSGNAEKPTRIFHLVVDELHLYRDTAGSEVACLLRMLLHQLDLPPVIDDGNGNKIPNPQLRILASSASLGDHQQTQSFLEDFFGIYNSNGSDAFYIQEGSDYIPTQGSMLDYSIFSSIQHDFVSLSEIDQKDKVEQMISRAMNGSTDIQDFVNTYQETIYYDFYQFTHHDGMNGVCVDDLINISGNNALFPDMESLRGFLIFRAYLDKAGIKHELPRFRFHQFFKYIEGLWGELQPTVRNQAGSSQELNQEPVSNLSYSPKEIGPNKHKILELLRCECCGQLYIGGNINRKLEERSLSINYPNLDAIPSFNPTPMVQNKSYNDYAIFYPTYDSNLTLENDEEHCSLLSNGDSTFTRTHARATWHSAYLSPITGEIKVREGCPDGDWIKGYIFELTNHQGHGYDPKQISALPCTCPHCKMNYERRTYVKSPIRSFRTGIDRSNQLLSKELVYQLSEENQKLIGFSDSREDAAKQAVGIAVEHYRDMVRVLFIDTIKELIESHNCNDPNNKLQEVVEYVQQLQRESKDARGIKQECKKKFGPDSYEWADEYLDQGSISPIPFIRIDTVSIREFDKANGPIASKLINLGINPKGVQPNNEQWYTDYANPTSNEIEELRTAIFNNAFGLYMGVSVCDTGMGYICIDPDILKQSQVIQPLQQLLGNKCTVQDFLDSFLRVMGDNYRYRSADFNNTISPYNTYADFKASMKSYVQKAASKLHCTEIDLGQALFNALRSCSIGANHGGLYFMILDMQPLAFHLIDKHAKYYYCKNCHRVHPIKGVGVCTRCGEDLIQSCHTNEDLWKHYISYDVMREKRTPMRLHTEELTGQTDDIQSRLLQFKDVVLTDPIMAHLTDLREQALPIDMVCVTTTMEVGVDIGSLEAIYQGNMPPTRYNYQQRVGRAGRRGQAYATAITFCRGRSHDLYYYEKATDRIVGGKVEPPTLTLAPYQDANGYHIKRAIMQRVITKHIMRLALPGLYDYEVQDTAAEFGTVGQWAQKTKQIFEHWLTNNSKDVSDIVHYYFDQFNINNAITQDIDFVEKWLKNELVPKIDAITASYPDPNVGLGQCLVEMGVLPKYGMPSDVRYFYHGFNIEKQKVLTIDRSSEMAITEFAPGAEKTKDKGKYKVSAICVPMTVGNNNQPQYVNPNADALANQFVAELSTTSPDSSIVDIKPYNQNLILTSNDKIVVLPQAYRAERIIDNTGRSVDNNDRGSRFAQSEIWAKNGVGGSSKSVSNCKISAYGFDANDAEVWHLNTNSRNWYYGDYNQGSIPGGGRTTFSFSDTRTPNSREICLGSRKVTEMICLELNIVPSVLDLDCRTGNKSAIRAAFISAGFLLQRALADQLDVTPEEIEVIEKIQNGRPMIYLSDALPNGAGIVGYLYKQNNLEDLIKKIIDFKTPFMQSFIEDAHRKKCLTACQECLDTYSNRGYHHILDWRMGVGILRLMIDDKYDFGFDARNRSLYHELTDYNELFDAAAVKVNGANQLTWDEQLYSIVSSIQGGPRRRQIKSCNVLYHPLWNKNELLLKRLSALKDINEFKYYNLFKVLRSNLTPDEAPKQQVSTVQPSAVGCLNVQRQNTATNSLDGNKKVTIGNLTITPDADL